MITLTHKEINMVNGGENIVLNASTALLLSISGVLTCAGFLIAGMTGNKIMSSADKKMFSCGLLISGFVTLGELYRHYSSS